MKTDKIKTKSTKVPVLDAEGKEVEGQFKTREIECEWVQRPENVAEALEAWGEEVTMALINKSADILFQNDVRVDLNDGTTDEAIKEEYKNWKPTVGQKRSRRAKPLSVDETFEQLSDDEQEAMIQRLMAKRQARQQSEAQGSIAGESEGDGLVQTLQEEDENEEAPQGPDYAAQG